jgi:hypothetical protein
MGNMHFSLGECAFNEGAMKIVHRNNFYCKDRIMEVKTIFVRRTKIPVSGLQCRRIGMRQEERLL